MSRTRKIFLFVALPLVLIFATIALLNVPKNRGGDQTGTSRTTAKQSGCEKNASPVFTAGFANLTQLKHIAPIGGVMVGSPARSYIVVKGAETPDREMATLFAPTNATLEAIVFARRDPSNPNAPGEYRLDFRASCEVTFHYDHLDDVSPAIKALAPNTPADSTREAKPVSLEIKAGEIVGYSDGTQQAGGFDFYLLNTDKNAPHINAKRWTWEQTTIADCPYDYFTKELKSQYYEMFRSQDGANLVKQECGSPSHDIAGTASGGWFLSESDTDSQGQWLELANINGRTELLHRDSGNHKFSVRDYQTKTLPDALTVGKAVCYSGGGKWAYVSVDSNNQLSLVRGTGSCPTSYPTVNVEKWYR